MVGEYDDASWQTKSAEHDEGIHRVEGDRDRGRADLSRVREMLAETMRPSRAMRAIDDATIPEEPTPVESSVAVADRGAPPADDGVKPVAAVPEPVVIPPVETVLPSAPVSAPPPSAPEAPLTRNPSPFDEIGFLRTVVGRATPYAGVQTHPTPRPSVAQPAPAVKSTPQNVPVAATPPVVPAPAPVSPPAPPAVVTPARASPQAIPSFDEPMLNEPAAPVVDAEAEARAAEAARTLKCQECGWMNYPTEWYCEKCGGELAAF
jgi:hypothetical protein